MSYQDVPAHKLEELLSAGFQLVDVREPMEVARGAHPQAKNIPLSELPHRFRELDRSRPVAVICQSGARSANAASQLVRFGFSRVASIAGGMSAVNRLSGRSF